MLLKGIGWVGTRTANYAGMVSFCRDVLGLVSVSDHGNFAEFGLPNGDHFEIFGADNPANPYMLELAVEFLVEDIEQARDELERRGAEFLSPIQGDTGGTSWTHFRAPDGQVYGLTSRVGSLES